MRVMNDVVTMMMTMAMMARGCGERADRDAGQGNGDEHLGGEVLDTHDDSFGWGWFRATTRQQRPKGRHRGQADEIL
jgi:hypothetical protein